MARFKRLTAAEARTLTRDQLLDRILAEQEYWHRKGSLTPEDGAALREFRRILHASLDPGAGIRDTLDYVNGVPGAGRYFDQRPDIPDAPPNGDQGVDDD